MRPLAAKPDLVAQTHDAIRSAIMSGDLAPCAPLAQEELAEQLGVSRQPISHALVLLKREGLVVDRGRKGQMVAPIDAEKLLGLYQVRGALDRLAARLAAEKRERGLLPLVEKGKVVATKGDLGAIADADIAFHKTLHDLSGNVEISVTAAGFWPHMARSMRVVLEDRAAWPGIWTEHEAIALAVAEGDVKQAGDLAARHAEKAGEATYRRLKDN
ncbi:MAG: GntR family transcriptional regulator [Rhodospirillaceae bacterium]